MPVRVAEKKFESEIEAALLAQGYEKGKPEDYETSLVLLPGCCASTPRRTRG